MGELRVESETFVADHHSLFYKMGQNPQWQTRLQEEHLTLKNPPTRVPSQRLDSIDITDPRELTFTNPLYYCDRDSLTFWPLVPGRKLYIALKACTIGGYYNISARTVV